VNALSLTAAPYRWKNRFQLARMWTAAFRHRRMFHTILLSKTLLTFHRLSLGKPRRLLERITSFEGRGAVGKLSSL
jgi:hypothetical protein